MKSTNSLRNTINQQELPLCKKIATQSNQNINRTKIYQQLSPQHIKATQNYKYNQAHF